MLYKGTLKGNEANGEGGNQRKALPEMEFELTFQGKATSLLGAIPAQRGHWRNEECPSINKGHSSKDSSADIYLVDFSHWTKSVLCVISFHHHATYEGMGTQRNPVACGAPSLDEAELPSQQALLPSPEW